MLVATWYFVIWGLGGSNYHVIAPFTTEELCNQERTRIVVDVGRTNEVTKCKYGNVRIPVYG